MTNQVQTAGMNWRPMSEAPRDGSRIVAWDRELGDWVGVFWEDGWRDYEGRFCEEKTLTHWLPIEPSN